MDFSIMFWGDTSRVQDTPEAYRGLLKLTRYADEHGYMAVWLPERHFHSWGGLHPNPAVLAAAAAMVTKRLRLRAGSVVLPLHHPVRVVEEWSVVDNLSSGRVELAVASGWKDDDFVLAPASYEKRKADTVGRLLETIQRLWRGEPYEGPNGTGKTVSVPILPRPVQPEVPIWVTSAGSLRTMVNAGGAGLNLLTHMLGQDYAEIEKKVGQYRAYRTRNGHVGPGKVAVMLHTFLSEDRDRARETVRDSMSAFLLNSADLAIPAQYRAQWGAAAPGAVKEMVDVAFDRYFDTASLMGTVTSCGSTVKRLVDMGVSEICCLVDFGLDLTTVFRSMDLLSELKELVDK